MTPDTSSGSSRHAPPIRSLSNIRLTPIERLWRAEDVPGNTLSFFHKYLLDHEVDEQCLLDAIQYVAQRHPCRSATSPKLRMGVTFGKSAISHRVSSPTHVRPSHTNWPRKLASIANRGFDSGTTTTRFGLNTTTCVPMVAALCSWNAIFSHAMPVISTPRFIIAIIRRTPWITGRDCDTVRERELHWAGHFIAAFLPGRMSGEALIPAFCRFPVRCHHVRIMSR